MNRYVIVKASRIYEGGIGYTGITLELANILPRVYSSKEEAQLYADVLSFYNLVGFRVEPYMED